MNQPQQEDRHAAPTPLSLEARRTTAGLSRPLGQKRIPIHMLYEGGGSALYEAIEQHPDYYLYGTERALLQAHAEDLIATLPPGTVLVELGCGDCTKTRILLEAMARRDGVVDFVGIDASAEGLASASARLAAGSGVRFTPIHACFFEGLTRAARAFPDRQLAVLLLGSTLGNMDFVDSVLFVRTLIEIVGPGPEGRPPRVVLGLDRWKDTERLRRAYDNDITARFELNGLRNALAVAAPGYHFWAEDWRYVVDVNPETSRVEMWAEAQRPLLVGALRVARGERILLEVSHKFHARDLVALYEGCRVLARWGEGYELVVLRPEVQGERNPWMGYGDADLEDIDRVARLDYAAFVRGFDWGPLQGTRRVLDVGCGSGTLPGLLEEESEASAHFASQLRAYDLLDISANSLRIAQERVPFDVQRRHHVPVQDLHTHPGFGELQAQGYDLVWSVHGITAVRPEDLEQSLENMLEAVAPGGQLLIVMSDAQSHYARVDRAYLADGGGERAPFLVAEDVAALLLAKGLRFERSVVQTETLFPATDAAAWRRFNAWCVYDADFDPQLGGPALQAYLAERWDASRGGWALRLSSHVLTLRRELGTLATWRAAGQAIPALSPERYARCCEAFEARSTQRARIVLDLAESGLLRRAAGRLRVLSLGAGDGTQDLALLRAALPPDFRGVLHYRAVDASPAQRARCADTLARAGGRLGQAVLEAQVLSEVELAEITEEEPFDLVLALHLLYYVPDPGAAVDEALARLRPGGRLLIWQAPKEAMNQLALALWAPQVAHPIAFAEEVEAALRERGLAHSRRRVDGAFTLPPEGPAREDSLSFLVQADCAQLSGPLRATLEREAEQLRGPDGAIPHPVIAFTVPRL